MKNVVVINARASEDLLKEFRHRFPHVDNIVTFTYDSSKSVQDNLNGLAVYSLHPSTTLASLYAYRNIFIEVTSRWVSFPREFEENYLTNFPSNNHFNVMGSHVLLALSRLINISDEFVTFVEYFTTNVNFFEHLKNNLQQLSSIEIEHILLAFYRLLKYSKHRFSGFVDTEVLYGLLKEDGKELKVAKFMAIQLLSMYFDASEISKNKMIKKYLGNQPLYSSFETDNEVDYRFLALLEAQRISNFKSMVPRQVSYPPQFDIEIASNELSSFVVSVYGILIPNVLTMDGSHKNGSDGDFVPIEKAVSTLKKLAHSIQQSRPVMLQGPSGSGKTFMINQLASVMGCQGKIVKIHLGEQTDAKLLLGTYTSGSKPGTFEWRSGVLTTAAKEGRWVLVEDIDKAPTEVLSVLLTLLEKKELTIASRGEVIRAANGFQIISTITKNPRESKGSDIIGSRLWDVVEVEELDEAELRRVLRTKFPLFKGLLNSLIACYHEISKLFESSAFISLNRGAHPRNISFRDLVKLCSRCSDMLKGEGIASENQMIESSIFENIFAEAVDCFGSFITEHRALEPVIQIVGRSLEIPHSRVVYYMNQHVPNFVDNDDKLIVGRATLEKQQSEKLLNRKTGGNSTLFARTNHSLRLMEQIGVAISSAEPLLLVGETGTGKTTIVQQLAKTMNKKLTVINVSQQTEIDDLLGGYKPVNARTIAAPLQELFETLFIATFSRKKNERFSQVLSKCFNKSNWKNVIRLWREAMKMASELVSAPTENSQPSETETSRKRRKLSGEERHILTDKWKAFERQVNDFEIQASSVENSFVFSFVEGSLVQAVRNGDWLLLDEINLASSDTLESIADLLAESREDRSILLSEKGDIESIKCHPNFRFFGCMNPSTDIGKRDLPSGIRSKFSEIYVHSPDRDIQDLLSIIDRYVHRYALSDEWIANDIAELYLEAKSLADANKIVDGANQKPHFSVRTLTRTLIYVSDIASIYGLRRALYEGFCMAFLTLLDLKSEKLLEPIIEKYTIGKLKNAKSVMKQLPPAPSSNTGTEYVQFKHYWLPHGPRVSEEQPHYIITPFVEKNMLNLVRAIAGARFPVLIQGPTSAGKTSMIQYLANITGHQFVRINNHEHTDLQEYLGTYISDSTGKLVFKEGLLVEALRKGHWIVLDELNLAPTDVLEALNRLLDDNRELLIPETQEVVRPHPGFMLFATQNPPGIYGGRKVLSRAFRNRFLELHFDDIPQDELEVIIKERCRIAPSYAKKIVEVYRELSVQRQSTRLFEQRNSFATLRDLFRWAMREAVGYEELAANGYMLLAERVRKEDEKAVVKSTIEKVMKVRLDMDAYYTKLEDPSLLVEESSIVWTRAMRRLAVLVSTAIKYREPLLLVGETGCGKTTICQILAHRLGRQLSVVNAHQNTETSDILGAQRPVRNRFAIQSRLFNNITTALKTLGIEMPLEGVSLENLVEKYDGISDLSALDPNLVQEIEKDKAHSNALFEWHDGPLVSAMKEGNFFLLDEISLADDSVLERFNSVLEPEKTLLLAEKGTEDASVDADISFEFLATMNPGGDYGKKELSAALRNRFTEIWVPSMDNFDDVFQIVKSKLSDSNNNDAAFLCDAIVGFSEWFGQKFGAGRADSGVISLRDILSWVTFVNTATTKGMSPAEALIQGASMVFIDALGTNNTAHLAESDERLSESKAECVRALSKFAGVELSQFSEVPVDVALDNGILCLGPFTLDTVHGGKGESFSMHAPTTAKNAMKVARAMQVDKPVLLEGSPGVGKTSLVSAVARLTGNALVRINLSEQTDLVDLFGSDAPAEAGAPGEFVWRDAPFLRAMQRGEWVLLDEMNLASQSVLEGLNACLDHRGEAYVPELDRSFSKHPGFKVFAAQNPQYQGGGRKGLPKSFVNRFTVVYVDVLKTVDLQIISRHLHPEIEEETRSKMIEFMSKLEDEVVTNRKWGSSGGPWEFNLRDTLRWLDLLATKIGHVELMPSDYLSLIALQRFRTHDDRDRAKALYSEVFGKDPSSENYFNEGPTYVQAGKALAAKNLLISKNSGTNPLALQCNNQIMESAIRCVNANIPLILTGPSSSGKTMMIKFLADVVGAHVDEFAMNSDVDSMDILGGYEQVDLYKVAGAFVHKVREEVNDWVVKKLTQDGDSDDASDTVASALAVFSPFGDDENAFGNFERSLASRIGGIPELTPLVAEGSALALRLKEEKSVRFGWFDGLLLSAVEKGHWLVLDNANLCNPSVLDRLNSLMEPNGVLVVNECSTADGSPRVVKPHPDFRLFLTVNPRYGELSRAMRNRSVEIFMDAIEVRATSFDRQILGLARENALTSRRPASAFIGIGDSVAAQLAVLGDSIEESLEDKTKVANAIASTIAFSTIDTISSWERLVCSSNEFSVPSKEAVVSTRQLISSMDKLGATASFAGIYEHYYGSQAIGDDFAHDQPVHPLVNPLFSTMSKDSNIESSEPSLAIENIELMIFALEMLSSIDEKALSGKLSELSYTEKSAAVSLGRVVRRAPKLNVYKLVRSVNEFVLKNMKKAFSGSALNTAPGWFRALYNLQLLWKSLVSGHERDESKLRVYKELVSQWVSQTRDTMEIDAETLCGALDSFGQELELTSGFSMDVMWERFRSSYPGSHEGWHQYKELLSLISEFDAVAWQQFHESSVEIEGLREVLVSYCRDVQRGGLTVQDFDTLYNSLKQGIDKLRQIVGTFTFARGNVFQHQFMLLANFVESSMLFHEKNTARLSQLATLAHKPTVSMIRLPNNNEFIPYPLILDSLWHVVDGVPKQLVTGLFSADFVSSTNAKLVSFTQGFGRDLQQNNKDLLLLAQSTVRESQAVLADNVATYKRVLVEWYGSIVEAHRNSFSVGEQTVLSGLCREALHAIISGEFSDGAVESLASMVDKSQNVNFAAINREVLLPALALATQAFSPRDLGKVWIMFACGALQLYTPSSPYDPAIREHVVYEVYLEHQKSSSELVKSWRNVRRVQRGDDAILVESNLPLITSSDAPSKPRVFRPSESTETLFDEWKAFLDSSINVNHIKALLESAERFASTDANIIELFQRNSSQFLQRLQTKYAVYSDVNDILRGYVLGLKLGLELMVNDAETTRTSETSLALTPLDTVGLANETVVRQLFTDAKEFTKPLPVDSPLPEQVMVYFVRLCFAHHRNGFDDLNSVLGQALQSLYYRWTLRRLKQEESSMQSSSLYKYSDPDSDIENDFRALFPDFEDVMEVDMSQRDKKVDFDDTYYSIAKLYIDEYLYGRQISMKEIVSEGAVLGDKLYRETASGSMARIRAPHLSSLMTLFGSIRENVGDDRANANANSKVNFYFGSSVAESRVAISTVVKVYEFTKKLLEEWPEHATLQNIATAADEYLMLPIKTPVARLLQKIEQLYTLIAEWEKYASSKVSLKARFDDLTQLIVRWRKLELSTWKSLFVYEDEAVQKSLGKWWFHLFETVIIPELSRESSESSREADDDNSALVKLAAALNVFLSECKYGEFRPRLNLVEAFKNHVATLSFGNESWKLLSNLLTFYKQFLPLVEENVANVKKELEKKVSEVILLASWKDVNIDALKQSAHRSHSNLYKIVRKYRALLATPVKPIVEAGISPERKPNKAVTVVGDGSGLTTTTPRPSIFNDEAVAAVVSKVVTWSERPAILRNASLLERNMESYMERIEAVQFADLYEYTKDLVAEMDRLRKETPSVLKDDNKKQVAALKTQKRKLLSTTLKELRHAGVKTTVKAKVKGFQATVNLILTNSTPFEGTIYEDCDSYYFRIMDVLPRLRAAVASPSEDVPVADAEKALAIVENLVFSLVATRAKLSELSSGTQELQHLYSTLRDVAELSNGEEELVSALVKTDTKQSLQRLEAVVFWMPKILHYAINVVEMMSSTGVTDAVDSRCFREALAELESLSARYRVVNSLVYRESASQLATDFVHYIGELQKSLDEWKDANITVAFVADVVTEWLTQSTTDVPRSDSDLKADSRDLVAEVENALRSATTSMLMAVQKSVKSIGGDSDQEEWLVNSSQQLYALVKATSSKQVAHQLNKWSQMISTGDFSQQSSQSTSALAAFTLPIARQYVNLVGKVAEKARLHYSNTAHATYILATSLHTLATRGFCEPEKPNDNKEDNNLQEGEGLGDGEGAASNSKDADEEDLSDDALEGNQDKEEKDNGDDENDSDAAEVDGDMAGDLEEASDQEDEGEGEDNGDEDEDMDEEVDDVDNTDPNALDEKMWDEEAQDNSKEKDTDQGAAGNREDDMKADEDEKDKDGEDKDNKDKDGEEGDDGKDEEEGENEEDGEDGEDKDVGEQNDEVTQQENEQLDENVDQGEALDLPDDMNLDDGADEEEDEEDEEADDGLDDNNEGEEGKDDEGEVDEAETEPIDEEVKEEAKEEAHEDEEDTHNEDNVQEGEDAPEGEEQEGEAPDVEAENVSEDESMGVDDKEEPEESADKAALEGAEGGHDDADDGAEDKESAVKSESGERGEGADNEVSDEKDDVGASGGASAERPDDASNEDRSESRDMAKESLKQLGDSLKEFHRRHQEIQEAQPQRDDGADQGANERPDEFQHVEGENADFDTQAMGAADRDQTTAIDEDKAIDDEDMETGEDVADQNTDMDIDDKVKEEPEKSEQSEKADPEGDNGDFESNSRAITEDQIKVKQDDDMMPIFNDENDDLVDYEDTNEVVKSEYVPADQSQPPVDAETARKTWDESDRATQELSAGLSEQLRLILEPTLATKLRGDYKTGKRLNMKRIIPFIASDFRKDKIWLRRTKPSKRQYQIMIAVDDSKSMSESKSTELAFHSIALVSKALTQLESGGLSIVRFGEDVKVIHPFDKSFNSQETGPRVFEWFDFHQQRTDVRALCSKSLKIFEDARATANSDLWQLQIILSDGVLEDHATVQRLVRRAREEKVMLVFVVIDGINSNESIMDMSQVSYDSDPQTGAMKLRVDKYLDSFPFEYYVIVKNINELPEMLSLILRQYFQMVA